MTVTRLENSLNKRPALRRVLGLSAGYWLLGFIADDKGAGENPFYQKAYYTLSAARSSLGTGYELLCMMIFIHTELGNEDLASAMLAQLGSSKNYIKNSNPFIYKVFLFLSSYTEIRWGKTRKAVKFLKQLDEFSPRKDKYTLLMMGIIYTEQGDISQGMEYLQRSLHDGCRSVFLYAWLHYAFINGAHTKDETLNVSYLKWALIHRIDIRLFINKLSDSIPPVLYKDPFWRELMSKSYPQNSLRNICENFMQDMNYSALALEYYKHADELNLELPDLYHFLIKSAYRSHAEKISRQAMERYLKSPDLTDVNLSAYVYHLLLINRNLSALVKDHREEILQFTARCLDSSVKGRYFYSLYAFYIVVGLEYKMPSKQMQNAANILRPVLFTYRLRSTSPRAKVIYLTEKQRQGIRVYKLTNGSTLVEASDYPLSFYSLNEDERMIVDVPFKVTRLVVNTDIKLYTFFYNQGMRGFNLLASITRVLFLQHKSDEFTIQILEDLLACKEISELYANQVKASLARSLYQMGLVKEAVKYYVNTNENTLPEAYIEDMLASFLAAGDFEHSALLVSRKSRLISDKSLFGALKQLSKYTKYYDAIAEPAFWLLTRSWYDRVLLEIVLKHYKGVQSDWQNLSRVLSSISITNEGLDSLILEKAVYLHQMSDDAQRIFARSVNRRLSQGGVDESSAEYGFMYFCIYEMLLNAFKPLYETIAVLEKLYLYNTEPYLAYALSHVYLHYAVTTDSSDRILSDACKEQEKKGILFPIFKTHQDKLTGNAYIEKKQPFIYRTLPGKNVFLYFRVKGDIYHKRHMHYLRFGLYACCISVFYGETIQYYFSEELSTGSITTSEDEVKGAGILFRDKPDDPFYIINNAIVFEQMFQYNRTEEILTEYLKKPKLYNAKLLP